MKMKSGLLTLAFIVLLASSVVSVRCQTVVTFDDLSETGSGAFFSSQYQGYQGLIWNNILCRNATLFTNLPANYTHVTDGLTGDFYGTVSRSNVAVMAGPSCEIDSPGTTFNFLSAYLTGEYTSNLNIEVQGFSGTNLLYDQTVVASATNPRLFTFDYSDIDRLYFQSSGGQPAFGYDGPIANRFIMDNFTFEFVPEPSALLLATFGALVLWPLLKRKRA